MKKIEGRNGREVKEWKNKRMECAGEKAGRENE